MALSSFCFSETKLIEHFSLLPYFPAFLSSHLCFLSPLFHFPTPFHIRLRLIDQELLLKSPSPLIANAFLKFKMSVYSQKTIMINIILVNKFSGSGMNCQSGLRTHLFLYFCQSYLTSQSLDFLLFIINSILSFYDLF